MNINKSNIIINLNFYVYFQIELDISKKYKNRPVYIIGTSIFGS